MTHPPDNKLSQKRKLLFKTLLILLSLSILLIVELGLRVISYGGSMRLFVDHKIENYEDYYIVNPFVGLKYFNNFKATEATNDIFLKRKPENSFRLFVLGSSTIYGFPYEHNLMATRILHKRLQDAYPDKTIELINTSITAINSVTLKDFAKQIVKYEPDAFLIYAGHNEFYGAFGVGSNEIMTSNSFLRSVHFKLINLRLYQLMQGAINKITGNSTSKSGDSVEKGTLMKRIVNDKEIAYNSDKYKQGIEQFEDNLNYILDLANKKDIPVFLSDIVSNVKDIPPFGNIGTGDQSAIFNFKAAEDALSAGDTVLAKKLYYTAKDLDPVRFRASEDINLIIHKKGKEKGSILIQAKESFSKASSGGIIGDNLLTEHVHPNIKGQFLLADIFYKSIIGSKLIGPSPAPLTAKSYEYYRQNWAYTPLDSLIGLYKVNQLKSYWPYKSMDNELKFRDVFKPVGMVENYAFKVITDPDASVENLHHTLGKYYENNENFVLALKEYEALAYINPYWSDYLNKAANALYNLKDLHRAENYLRESMKYTKSYFSYTMLGEIEFIKHDYDNALNLFEYAHDLSGTESIDNKSKAFLFSRLYYLYHIKNDDEKKQNINSELQKLGQKQSISVQEYPFEYSNFIPYNIESEFNKAISHSSSNIDSTLYYLNRCLQINDCPLINMYIADILYQKQDLKALQYYMKAYDAYDEDPDFLVKIFYAYFVNVNKSKAEEILKQLRKIDPSNNEIPRLGTLLTALQ